ncbi:MAG TPA: dual specificity protein phosphatase family protein [Chlamydiales bacterium]|nr:dual specificity protein phosphatase family protein [Chlamydiales bacterium]
MISPLQPLVAMPQDAVTESVYQTFPSLFEEFIQGNPYIKETNARFIIGFSGVPGMGKSTLAKGLEEYFHAIRLSSDDARDLLRRHALSPRYADAFLSFCLEELLKVSPNGLFILDRSVDRTWDRYLEFAGDHGFGTFIVRLKLPIELVNRRIKARGRDVEPLLRNLKGSWKDYEFFLQRHKPQFVFDASDNDENQFQELVDAIESQIPPRMHFAAIAKDSDSASYEKVRTLILNAEEGKVKVARANMQEILPGLFLGSQEAANECASFPYIQRVLTCRTELVRPEPPAIIWKTIAIDDAPYVQLKDHFSEVFSFLDSSEEGACLVHCRMGVSRSASFVIAYLMHTYKVSYEAALQFVRTKRPQVQPNQGFEMQLINYEQSLINSR